MTTLTFLGSHCAYEPTCIRTTIDQEHVMKYRGQPYQATEAIATTSQPKGLKYRGVAY
jgi:hypothetical protein